MADQEQLAAWTRLKVHLVETMQLLENAKKRTPDSKVHAEIDAVVVDIEENMDVIEEMFICSLGI